jgi:hypothetical protein
MTERSRPFLRNEFDDGERPTGADFGDLIDSFVSILDDGISVDGDSNLAIPGGINLGDTATGQPGTLRFNSGQVEVFDGGAFIQVGGSGGAFAPVANSTDVAYAAGNVGVGNFAVPPTYRLEVELGNNTSTGERVRMGNLVVHNGQNSTAAHICHQSVSGDNTAYAVQQDAQGNTVLNCRSGAQLQISQGETSRMQVLSSGNLSLTPQQSLSILGNTAIGRAGDNRNLMVYGQASKLGGGPFNNLVSDARAKEDVRPLEFGLDAIRKLKPVYYRYKKELSIAESEREYVGLTAQNVRDHLPFMIQESELKGEDPNEPMLTYNEGPLMFIMINAIKQLVQQVESLEARVEELESADRG